MPLVPAFLEDKIMVSRKQVSLTPPFPHPPPFLQDKMLSINIVIGVFHALRCIDPSGYANRLTLKNFHTVFTGMCVACPQHIGFLLVESWITIVDGGKNKKTPR